MAALSLSPTTMPSNWSTLPILNVVQDDVPTDAPWEGYPTEWSEVNASEWVSTMVDNVTAGTTQRPRRPPRRRGPSITTILTYKWSNWLWLYFAPVLIFGGGISNLMAIVVLRNRLFRGTGTTFLLTALAVADTTVLLTNVLRQWILHLTELDVRKNSDAACRIHLFVTYFSPQWSAWTLVLVTAERAVSVCWPFKAKILCSRKRIVMAWILFTLIVAAVNFPILIKYKLFVYRFLRRDNTVVILKFCRSTSQFFLNTVIYWSDFAMINAGPCFVIFFLNIVIIFKLARPGVDRKNDKNAKKILTSVTVMLLVVSIIFLVTTTPVVAFFLGKDTFFKDARRNVYVSADQSLTYAVTNLLSYVNNSINFLLYCVSGSRFRKALKEMFCGRCLKDAPNTIDSKTNSTMLEDTKGNNTAIDGAEDTTKM